ncbi:hypothetical protein ACLOJK_026641 [Asimina triloba]
MIVFAVANMATTEVASSSSGPRFAPEDPSLPKPWKGLIDGSTNRIYYWNPETNVTQYEKPAALPPPLSAGLPPAATAPKLAPIPMARTMQPNGTVSHQGQQMLQQASQQMPQQLGQQMPQQLVQPITHQQAQQISQQQGQQMLQQQGQHFPQQQLHQMPHQQIPFTQGQQISQQQVQQTLHPQGQHFPHQQGQPFGYIQEEIGIQQGNQPGLSSSHTSIQNLPSGSHAVHIPQMSVAATITEQTASASHNLQQQGASVPLHHAAMDSIHRPPMAGPMPQNKTGLGIAHNQQGGGPRMGFKMGYEEDQHGRSGNEFYYNSAKPVINPQQPNLAPIPPMRNQQENVEMRMGPMQPQNFAHGHGSGLNMGAGHAIANMYGHPASGQAFADNGSIRSSPRPDLTNMSPAEVYRQQHEVTATFHIDGHDDSSKNWACERSMLDDMTDH